MLYLHNTKTSKNHKMIIKGNTNVILFIEPAQDATPEPLIDDLTIKMFNCFKEYTEFGHVGEKGSFTPQLGTKGLHYCVCGTTSHNCDYILKNGQCVNWLCVHYLAYHRSEIPEEELEKVRKLTGSTVLDESDEKKFNIILGHPSEKN